MKSSCGPVCLAAIFLFVGCSSDTRDTVRQWQPLFDGHSLAGWHAYGSAAAPGPGWKVENGILKKLDGQKGGDIVTDRQFADFDLEWDWRVAPGANNGVKYLVSETRKDAPGHEYQMLDDERHPDAKIGPKRQTASFYDVLPPAADKPYKPAGEWNHSRILVQGNHVEHWLNGAKVVSYELGSPEIKAAIAKSKFKNVAGFADKTTGPIMLTDHHDEAWFRDIRIKELR